MADYPVRDGNGDIIVASANASGYTPSLGNPNANGGSGSSIYDNLALPLFVQAIGSSSVAQSMYHPTNAGILDTVAPYLIVPDFAAGQTVVQGNLRKQSNRVYRVSTAGTNVTGAGPIPAAGGSDGTVTWSLLESQALKAGNCFMTWLEILSGGALLWDMDSGYGGTQGGIVKVFVEEGGTGYAASDTLSCTNGGVLVPVISGGAIRSVIVINPGWSSSASFDVTVNTATGSGAVFRVVHSPAGTFGVPGCTIETNLLMVPDVLASKAQIIKDYTGINNVTADDDPDDIIAMKIQLIEALVDGGKIVNVTTIPPRYESPRDDDQIASIIRINNAMRDYASRRSTANVSDRRVLFTDMTKYFVDGASGLNNWPVGGASGVGAILHDGTHLSPKGAMLMAHADMETYRNAGLLRERKAISRSYSQADGFDPVRNPGGNRLEGLPRRPLEAYDKYALINNDSGKLYQADTAGVSAAGVGPTGTGTEIIDGGARWDYVRNAGLSVLQGPVGGTKTAAAGITYGAGDLHADLTLTRAAGNSVGNVNCAIITPYDDGFNGKFQRIAFDLAGGTIADRWTLTVNSSSTSAQRWGISAEEDYGVAAFEAMMEIVLSGVQNMNLLNLTAGGGIVGQNDQNKFTLLNNNGELIEEPYPAPLILRTPPIVYRPYNTTFSFTFSTGFAANLPAKAVIDIRYMRLIKITGA